MTRSARAAMLSALLWPGAGQIYKRERAKGTALVVAAAMVAVVIVVVVWGAVSGAMPREAAEIDPVALASAIRAALVAQGTTLGLLHGVLGVVWIYAVVDAWREGS